MTLAKLANEENKSRHSEDKNPLLLLPWRLGGLGERYFLFLKYRVAKPQSLTLKSVGHQGHSANTRCGLHRYRVHLRST